VPARCQSRSARFDVFPRGIVWSDLPTTGFGTSPGGVFHDGVDQMPHRYHRLTQPLIRERPGPSGFRPATWDEALDRAAAGLRRVVADHGPGAFGLFSCSKSTNEVNYIAQKFARTVVGSNNIDSCNRT
jgi:predicted molibdopterin-dependent oxidoreductase YjgC